MQDGGHHLHLPLVDLEVRRKRSSRICHGGYPGVESLVSTPTISTCPHADYCRRGRSEIDAATVLFPIAVARGIRRRPLVRLDRTGGIRRHGLLRRRGGRRLGFGMGAVVGHGFF